MQVTLKSKSSTAVIETKGAELISFKDSKGKEYMWQKDPEFWGRCSPVLFPVVGNLRDGKIAINGKEYEIEKHGFCRDRNFEIVEQADDKLVLNTCFDDDTLKAYPFKFSLTLAYFINENSVSIEYTVSNLGDDKMIYCLGAHPAFNVPLDDDSFEDYSLSFSAKESDGCPVYDGPNSQVDVNNRIFPLDAENKLKLTYETFDNDALIFDFLKSKTITLSNLKTNQGVRVDLEGFDSVAFWTPRPKKAPFLCIEPWNGMAVRSDEIGDKAGFENKFSARELLKNEKNAIKMTITHL